MQKRVISDIPLTCHRNALYIAASPDANDACMMGPSILRGSLKSRIYGAGQNLFTQDIYVHNGMVTVIQYARSILFGNVRISVQ